MRFEWAPQKNEANIRKHGLNFADAPEIFAAPMLSWLDTRYDYEEDRWCGIGLTHGRVVKLAYTERDRGETVRIISLRKANSDERTRYWKALAH